jgi:hypothetical protein
MSYERGNGLMAEEGAVKKYEFMEGLPGVGPATAQKLRELGFHTVESLAMATARELEPAGISEKKAFAVIETARSSIGVSFIRADELLKMRQHVLRLTSGSKVVDRLLDGGLETQTIPEFYGEFGTGKSQICHQLCVNVQLPPERGGLSGTALRTLSELSGLCRCLDIWDLSLSKLLRTLFTLRPTLLITRCFCWITLMK